MRIIWFLAFFVAPSSQTILRGPGPLWNSLKTTFALDGVISWVPGYNSTGYSPVPRTKTDAVNAGWEPVSSSPTCNSGGLFQGFQYVYRVNATYRDYTVSALYDTNGIIAGIQMNILQSAVKTRSNTYKYDKVPMYVANTIDSNLFYTLTAYFVDPATICSLGQAARNLTTQGTGSAIYFQNGTDATNLIQAPMNRGTALADGWSNNDCFVGMGVHNWYRVQDWQATNCDYLLPVFLLYNLEHELLGFGFQSMGLASAPRYENPGIVAVAAIVGPQIPKCLVQKVNAIGVTTMHVWLINKPLLQNCVVPLD